MNHLGLSIALAFCLSSCCGFGREVAVWEHVESLEGPSVVVYYPEHGTWNTPFMRTTIRVDGEDVGRLCEGDFLTVPLEPGTYVLSTSCDKQSGCSGAMLRPKEGWPPVEVEVTDGPVLLRFGEEPYPGPSSSASICYRHLTLVGEETARGEVERLDLVE